MGGSRLGVFQQYFVHIIDCVAQGEIFLQHQLGRPHQVQAGSGDPDGETVRVEHSHWSGSVEILCSDWLNLTMLAPRSMP